MIGRIWEPLLAHSLGPAPRGGPAGRPGRGRVLVRQRTNGADILAEFHSLGDA